MRRAAAWLLLLAVAVAAAADGDAPKGPRAADAPRSSDVDLRAESEKSPPEVPRAESEKSPRAEPDREAASRRTGPPVYVPPAPARGASPRYRIGGATRGPVPRFEALAPDHLGHTARAEPVLYWWSSSTSELPLEFALVNEETGEELFNGPARPSVSAGVQALALAELDLRLEPDVPHRWYVGIEDAEHGGGRPLVLVGGGILYRAAPTPEASQGDLLARAREAAALGFWYDALDEIGRGLRARPGDEELRAARRALLLQVRIHLP